ncbi:MAG: hypothetical protein ACR2MK_03375 [Solirubrobacteraceae bacterium]
MSSPTRRVGRARGAWSFAVLDAYAVQTYASSPHGECSHAVLGDHHQPRPEAELGSKLTGTGPEADDLGPLPRRVV